jgi:hypothetical protein
MDFRKPLIASAALLAAGLGQGAGAQDVREFSFGYDQPHSTG